MSLNKFMHPRNRYKNARPNFKALGEKYPEFQEHLTENDKGKPMLDFQNPEALRVLTICMMKEDYDLKIELPADRLVPTLPLRLNYVHWIEDITKDWNKEELKGIDIGTGACCVYPLLAISANPWQFLATEADEVNFSYAQRNLEKNKLTKRIQVVKVSTDVILEGVIGQTEDSYDFCMCNPPFFADHFEAQGLVSRSPSRPDAKTMSTASPQEGIVQGGEVAFVRRMIEESNFLQHRVRVYTTMLGKKASLVPLKEILRRFKVTNFGTTEFCQGKTMRWGLAWSFDKSVTFPKSLFSQGKKEGKKSVVHIIHTQMGERREPVSDLVVFFKHLFAELKIHVREGKQSKSFSLLTLTAAENTWIHSRRKRRQMLREVVAAPEASQPASAETSQPAETETSQTAETEISQSTTAETSQPAAAVQNKSCSDSTSQCESSAEKENGTKQTPHSTCTVDHSDPAVAAAIPSSKTDRVQEPPLASAGQGIASAEGNSHKKRTLDTGDESAADSLPAKRLRVEESSEQQCDKQAVNDEPPAESARVQSKEAEVADEMESDAAVPSDVVAGPSEGDASCSATDSAIPREEGEGVVMVLKGKDRPPSEFVLKCHMSVRVQGSDLAVELAWLDGQDIQLMHQLMQVFKNRLAQREYS